MRRIDRSAGQSGVQAATCEAADDARGELLGIDLPIEPYLKAAEELKSAGVEVVVLRMNCSGGRVERFVEAVEATFKPRFRTVGWARNAVGGAAVAAAAVPEVCMTSDAFWGATTSSAVSGDMEAWLKLGERASKSGQRPPELVRSMQIVQPLSISLQDGKRVFLPDESGTLTLNKRGGLLCMNAATAAACGASVGTADNRAGLVRALGLEQVEWVGADIDARVSAMCQEAAADLSRTRELYASAVLAYGASKSASAESRRELERGKRDAAWSEIKRLRSKWPELSSGWPSLLFSKGWGVHQTAQWDDIAKEVGIETAELR